MQTKQKLLSDVKVGTCEHLELLKNAEQMGFVLTPVDDDEDDEEIFSHGMDREERIWTCCRIHQVRSTWVNP